MKLVEFEKAAVNADVVAALENWLVAAKEGRLQAIAMVGLRPDGGSVTKSSGTSSAHGLVSQHALLGGLLFLQRDMMEANPGEEGK